MCQVPDYKYRNVQLFQSPINIVSHLHNSSDSPNYHTTDFHLILQHPENIHESFNGCFDSLWGGATKRVEQT